MELNIRSPIKGQFKTSVQNLRIKNRLFASTVRLYRTLQIKKGELDMAPTINELNIMLASLQKILRIQDWDVEVYLKNNREMDSICKLDYITSGYCERYRELKQAKIYLNFEDEEYEKDWYFVFMHEIYHIVIDDFDYTVENAVDFITEKIRKDVKENVRIQKERLVCNLAKGFINVCSYTELPS